MVTSYGSHLTSSKLLGRCDCRGVFSIQNILLIHFEYLNERLVMIDELCGHFLLKIGICNGQADWSTNDPIVRYNMLNQELLIIRIRQTTPKKVVPGILFSSQILHRLASKSLHRQDGSEHNGVGGNRSKRWKWSGRNKDTRLKLCRFEKYLVLQKRWEESFLYIYGTWHQGAKRRTLTYLSGLQPTPGGGTVWPEW